MLASKTHCSKSMDRSMQHSTVERILVLEPDYAPCHYEMSANRSIGEEATGIVNTVVYYLDSK